MFRTNNNINDDPYDSDDERPALTEDDTHEESDEVLRLRKNTLRYQAKGMCIESTLNPRAVRELSLSQVYMIVDPWCAMKVRPCEAASQKTLARRKTLVARQASGKQRTLVGLWTLASRSRA